MQRKPPFNDAKRPEHFGLFLAGKRKWPTDLSSTSIVGHWTTLGDRLFDLQVVIPSLWWVQPMTI